MKYLYIGISVLAVLLAVCIISNLWAATGLDGAQASLSAALDALNRNDFAAAVAHGADAAAQWEARKNVFSVLSDHEALDEISVGFSALHAYAAEHEVAEYRARCRELLLRLDRLARADLPFYYNFL